jgi:multicomponent Na+:H+ antiporter subunit D
MTIEWVHPGLILIIGAWLVPLFKGGLRRSVMLAVPSAALATCLMMRPGTFGVTNFLGQELIFGRVDQLSLVFSYVFSFMAVLGMIYALHVNDSSQHVAALTYAGGALGVTFAGDFLSLYIFWELMAISAALLVMLRREAPAVAAGFRYLLVHVFGGLLLLGGILLHWTATGSLAFGDMGAFSGGLAWGMILVAFLLNAAVPPLGALHQDSYTESTVTGAVLLTPFKKN